MSQQQSLILLADESRFFLTMEKQFLRNVPATILEAQSAAQTLEICRTTPPQLIYLADALSDRDGISCCREIKSDPKLAGIPVVLISENGHAAGQHCCGAGCSAVLTKPLDRYRFLETGRKFLAGIRERRRSCLIGVRMSGSGQILEGKGLDISSGGVFVESGIRLPVGTELHLELHLARPHETGPRIACTGIVAWLNTKEKPIKPHHPVGFGIKFGEVPPKSIDVLSGYLKVLDRMPSPAA